MICKNKEICYLNARQKAESDSARPPTKTPAPAEPLDPAPHTSHQSPVITSHQSGAAPVVTSCTCTEQWRREPQKALKKYIMYIFVVNCQAPVRIKVQVIAIVFWIHNFIPRKITIEIMCIAVFWEMPKSSSR